MRLLADKKGSFRHKRFPIEFDGHEQQTRARKALERKALRLEVLGSYLKSPPVG